MNKNLWKLLLQKYCSSTLIAMKKLYAKFNPNLISKLNYLMLHYEIMNKTNDSIDFNNCLLSVNESVMH